MKKELKIKKHFRNIRIIYLFHRNKITNKGKNSKYLFICICNILINR